MARPKKSKEQAAPAAASTEINPELRARVLSQVRDDNKALRPTPIYIFPYAEWLD